MAANVWGTLNVCTDIKELMHVIALGGCMHITRESALKADPERNIHCPTGEWNLC